jgi:hypothetical protein
LISKDKSPTQRKEEEAKRKTKKEGRIYVYIKNKKKGQEPAGESRLLRVVCLGNKGEYKYTSSDRIRIIIRRAQVYIAQALSRCSTEYTHIDMQVNS